MALDELARDPKAAWAVSRTVKMEGGLVDNPADPGGITDHGISLRFALQEAKVHPDHLRYFDIDHDGDVDRADIRGLTTAEAADILYQTTWKPGPYGKLEPTMLAWKVFDIAVNTGPRRAIQLLQCALVDVGQPVVADAVFGPKTLAAVQRAVARDGGAALLGMIRKEQATFYRSLADSHPPMKVFLNGWLNRAAA